MTYGLVLVQDPVVGKFALSSLQYTSNKFNVNKVFLFHRGLTPNDLRPATQ